jgi:hypothetical protein
VGAVASLACVALAAVFAVSGVAKLSDRAGTREAVAGFGVPASLTGVVATGLAPAELATALLLVLPSTAAVGLVLAAALLAAFTAAVVLALRAGRRPDCNCFGRLGGADISSRTVVRSLVLLALAGLGLVPLMRGGDEWSVGGVVAGLTTAAAVIAGEWWAGRTAQRRRDAEAEATFADASHSRAPDFRLPSLSGGETSLADLLAPGLPLLLITLSPGCGSCRKLRPDVAQWGLILSPRVTVAVLATGTLESNLAPYADAPHLTVLIDSDRIRDTLRISSTPSAVVIGPDGLLASGVASGEERVRRLLVQTLTGTQVEEIDPSEPHNDDPDGTPIDEVDLSSTVAARAGVEAHQVGDTTVLLDTATGATVALDQIGALVWSVLDGSDPLEAVVRDLADVFGAPVEQVSADVLALVRSLGAAGLLDGVAPAAATAHHGHEHVHVHAGAG